MRYLRVLPSGVLSALLCSLLWTQPSGAGSNSGPPCRPGEVRGGTVYEYSPHLGVDFTVQLTDSAGLPLGAPIRLIGQPAPIGGTQASLRVSTSSNACDAINTTVRRLTAGGGGGGDEFATAVLWLETIYYDLDKKEYYLGDIFETIYTIFGPGVRVRIPDLYADTNGDGHIGDDDILYSLVDLAEYLIDVPTFDFGNTYVITDGKTVGLPGMYFSTTDFVFSPTSDMGFDYTPYTGTGEVMTDHALEAPAPASFALLVGGLALLGAARNARKR